MNAQDDESDICRIGSRLVDVADLYDKAADHVEDARLTDFLRGWGSRRRRMGDELLARAGVSGQPTGSILPTPDQVWLDLKSLFSSAEGTVLRSLQSADEELMVMLNDFLKHSDPSALAASAGRWLEEALKQDLKSTRRGPVTSATQPG